MVSPSKLHTSTQDALPSSLPPQPASSGSRSASSNLPGNQKADLARGREEKKTDLYLLTEKVGNFPKEELFSPWGPDTSPVPDTEKDPVLPKRLVQRGIQSSIRDPVLPKRVTQRGARSFPRVRYRDRILPLKWH
ncbi:hypothetical protein LWI29_033156 [Acer saccharum]|uniref:Uncharacterized protein n=1 Tax=Acer saccharum TaxID=4024 RepID=A0AA39REU0_ACESA|nr:hypothetical protein LWI29_033156 [Acer saccharum]